MCSSDLPPGRHTLGPLEMEVGADGVVRMPGASNFAGSSLTLDAGVSQASAWLGISIESARAMASTTPAAALGFA